MFDHGNETADMVGKSIGITPDDAKDISKIMKVLASSTDLVNRIKIMDVLKGKLGSVYCGGCGSGQGDADDWCECCHRKAMNWNISEKFAAEIAKEILKGIK